MHEHREIEAKFDVGPDDAERLLSVRQIGAFTVCRHRAVHQDDLYFDTRDAVLARNGSTLRVRRNEAGTFMTFKGRREATPSEGEAHIATRLEDEVRLDPAYAEQVSMTEPLPGHDDFPPLQRARQIAGDAVMTPVARLVNDRTVIDLRHSDGAELELSIDRCVGIRLADGRAVEFREIELETRTADRKALVETAEALQRLVPSLHPSGTTKLERTLS